MRKYWYRRILIVLAISTIIAGGFYYGPQMTDYYDNETVNAESADEDTVLLGGMPAGIYLETDGVMVLGTAAVQDTDGNSCEPAKNLVKAGDYIVGINGESIQNKEELVDALENLEGKEVVLDIHRDEDTLSIRLQAVCVNREEYKLGIWVRDNTQGLGTITYLTQSSRFGALGHGIHDVDTNELLSISKGSLYDTSIRSIIKGKSGTPGSMEGIIVYNQYNKLGTIDQNTEAGIYGTLEKMDRLFEEQIPVEIGTKDTIEKGPAQIRCCIGDSIEFYDIEILEIDKFSREVNKGLVIQITDEKLLEETGGIIQGMSGSPIIQGGKIIGAVTHVLVNDPTRGYGIFIENMLDVAG